MRVLIWHVHGSWTTAFVNGPHTYLVPVVPDRSADGRGRAETFDWPPSVQEVTPAQLAAADIDVVVLQRPDDEVLARRWLGPRFLRLPTVWLEHNAPQGRVNDMRHPAADRHDLTLVHVTHTNALFWDSGSTPTTVIEHGICDPGHSYTGELARGAVVINEPVRRARVVGTDLLPRLAAVGPLDLFGMETAELAATLGAGGGNLPHAELLHHLARRRVYLHTVRWTSLGLSLLEAMALGMPVVALATTEVPAAVPAGAGVVTNRIDEACAAFGSFLADPDAARRAGDQGRQAVLERYGLKRFLDDWDRLLEGIT